MNSGFDPRLWDPKKAPTLFYGPYCLTRVAGNSDLRSSRSAGD